MRGKRRDGRVDRRPAVRRVEVVGEANTVQNTSHIGEVDRYFSRRSLPPHRRRCRRRRFPTTASTIAQETAGLTDSRSIVAARTMTSKQGALFQRGALVGPARSAPFHHFRRRTRPTSVRRRLARAAPTPRTVVVVAADTKAVAPVQLPRRTKALVDLSLRRLVISLSLPPHRPPIASAAIVARAARVHDHVRRKSQCRNCPIRRPRRLSHARIHSSVCPSIRPIHSLVKRTTRLSPVRFILPNTT